MLIKVLKYSFSKQGRKAMKYWFARNVANPILRPCGYTLITDHFYQPIPNRQELLVYEACERPLGSLRLNSEAQKSQTARLLSKYSEEHGDAEKISYFGYVRKNSAFGSGDAEFLYSMVREAKPRKVIEIGSGSSTLITGAALRQNHFEDDSTAKLISIEPFPQPFLTELASKAKDCFEYEMINTRVQDVDLKLFDLLEANDILFVDSSHVFKQGSDVEFEFLSVYPRLKKGVFVHIHDIFFPHDYPLDWNAKEHRFWNEQYHLETFLQFNNRFEVISSLSAVCHHDKSVFSSNIKNFDEGRKPGSFWMVSI